jgi:hypothetical protein
MLTKGSETVLMHYRRKGALTHLWFGGEFKKTEFIV